MRRFYRDEDFLLYLNRVDSYFDALNQPFPARLQRLAALDEELRKTKSRGAVSLISGEQGKTARNDAEIQARLFVAHVALAVERYRLGHDGRLPDRLSDLVPDYLPSVPLDPFCAEALRYKPLKNGFVVYSIGPDGRDNGGVDKPERPSDATSHDLPFAVER
jgi:hypothetical protein